MNNLPDPTLSQTEGNRNPLLLQTPWSRRETFLTVIVGMVMLLGLALLLNLGMLVLARVTGRSVPPQVAGVITIGSELGLLLPVWWWGVRKYHLPWSALGLRRFDVQRGFGLGCVSLLMVLAGNFTWSLFLSVFGLRAQPDMLALFGGGVWGLLLALLAGGIIAPVAEEVFFRGYVFAALYKYLGLRRATLLSAALFALVHVLPTSWPPLFLLGILLALLYEQTDSLWPAIAVHAGMNTLGFLLLYVAEVFKL